MRAPRSRSCTGDPISLIGRGCTAGDKSATAISSAGGGENPGLKYFDNRYRGYALLKIIPESISARLRTVDDIEIPGSAVRTLKTLDIRRGAAGIVVHDGDVPASSLRA